MTITRSARTLDFTSALDLGLTHSSSALRPWSRFATGVPATRVRREQATPGTSTRHMCLRTFGAQWRPKQETGWVTMNRLLRFDPDLEEFEWEGEVNRGSRQYAMWVQSSLNKIQGLRLAVDGKAGTQTRSAIRSFQQQRGLAPDGRVGSMTEAALIRAGAATPPGGFPAPSHPQPYPRPSAGPQPDPAIEALNLAEPAKSAASRIKATHPWVVFTSGRRSLAGQARAMAGNVVNNRQWIVETYVASPIIAAAQQWVDAHPEARTQQAIADGLLGVFQSFPPSEAGRISRHLVGLAFDIQPVPSRWSEIKATIWNLPGMTKFLSKEGGLTIWHVQF